VFLWVLLINNFPVYGISKGELLHKFLMIFDDSNGRQCDDTALVKRMEACTSNINTILQNDWYIQSVGCQTIVISKKTGVIPLNERRPGYDSLMWIYLTFTNKFDKYHVEEKVKFYDTTINQMKNIFNVVYPNSSMLKTPFIKLVAKGVDSLNIVKYNALSEMLWVNENDFPKFYTKDDDICIIYNPDIDHINTTAYSDMRKILKDLKLVFLPYIKNTEW
jgi:uncharacterized protein YneR